MWRPASASGFWPARKLRHLLYYFGGGQFHAACGAKGIILQGRGVRRRKQLFQLTGAFLLFALFAKTVGTGGQIDDFGHVGARVGVYYGCIYVPNVAPGGYGFLFISLTRFGQVNLPELLQFMQLLRSS